MNNEKWWFGFCQTLPKPPGQAIACGPFDSHDVAQKERERAKAWDCEVSMVYSAFSKAKAEEQARHYLRRYCAKSA
ncbi:MAG: hypothetical protein PHH11_11035 [Methylomonas sp.]|nr:hypothetical protein [Methylomonas sp.]